MDTLIAETHPVTRDEPTVADAEGPFPPLVPPPEPTEGSRRAHAFFLALNRWSTTPIMRAGLGAWFATPIGGYVLLLRVRGRKSGRVIDVPLSYLIAEGAPWVCAGFGPATQWYRNIRVDPRVEVILPGRAMAAVAEEVRDPAVRARIVPALVRAVGLPGAMGGVDPRRDPDERILEAYAWVPLVRLRPLTGPIVAGPDDPGGTAWIWRQALVTAVLALGISWVARSARRLLGGR